MIKNLDIKLKTQRAKEKLSQPKFCKKYGFKVVTYKTAKHYIDLANKKHISYLPKKCILFLMEYIKKNKVKNLLLLGVILEDNYIYIEIKNTHLKEVFRNSIFKDNYKNLLRSVAENTLTYKKNHCNTLILWRQITL